MWKLFSALIVLTVAISGCSFSYDPDIESQFKDEAKQDCKLGDFKTDKERSQCEKEGYEARMQLYDAAQSQDERFAKQLYLLNEKAKQGQ